jgi:hypothetical protein
MLKLPGFTAGFSLGAAMPAAQSRVVRSRYKYVRADSVEAAPMALCYELTIECSPAGCHAHCDDNFPHGGGGGGAGDGGDGDGGGNGGRAIGLDASECREIWQECLRFCDLSPTPYTSFVCQLGCDAVYAGCRLLPA